MKKLLIDLLSQELDITDASVSKGVLKFTTTNYTLLCRFSELGINYSYTGNMFTIKTREYFVTMSVYPIIKLLFNIK